MDNKSYPMPESDNTPTPSLLERPQPSLTEADPKVISNRYTVVDRLGEGGMGKVYRAIDPIINRTVAIKILPFNNYSDEQFRRFQQEARAASKLNHPGIVTALDFGLTDEQNPFLVMEHIEGETLDEMLMKNGPLEPEVFLSVFSQITCSMIHAHSKGVIHRDLKPSNIMINFDNGEVKAFVLDFGIAKLLDDADSLASTQTGQVVGSPRCISPEQIYGKNLDGRSDLYSLGCVMFEALTGEPPFKGETAMDTIQMHLNSKPPRLADKSASSFSNALEQLIARTLAKRAAERYQSMEGLLKALETIETEPEKQSPPDEADDTREKPSSTNLASTNLASTNL
ncbi:MAG: serine/threonine protein kinase, partial [Candidatus Obscuribacterales bacterium]|nr:serine/threonine protein kinase [Candidatus Obscuribacterales bacterium]